MGLAETAELLVKLTMKDETSATAKKATGELSTMQKTALGVATVMGGALTKGALDAEAAQGKFMAATGKSREEAKKFVTQMDGLAGSSGAVGLAFEDIAETGTMVEQQFGTTGDETRNLTDDILKFAKVTGQDATGAASDLEDTLSSFGLEADDASGFMDELVASNQKFGTDVGPEALDVLRNMSPALQTMGGDLQDGVGFLNLFETAGLDANTAATGLSKAVLTLKPGQTLDDLIAQVSSIEDPLKRAQAAAEIFGSKAGPKLAAVLKPGVNSLDDFKVNAKEAGGSLDTAAGDMLTATDKIRGVFDKLGAGARELGQEFGPAVTAVGTLAPAITLAAKTLKLDDFAGVIKDKLTDAMSAVWEGVGKQLGGGAADAAGEVVGEAFGDAAAEGAGSAIAEGAGGTIIGNLSADAIKKGAENSGYLAGQKFGLGVSLGIAVAVPSIGATVGNLFADVIDSVFGSNSIRTQINAQMAGTGTPAGIAFGEAAGDAAVMAFYKDRSAWGDLADIFGDVEGEASEIGQHITLGVREGVTLHRAIFHKDLDGMIRTGIGVMRVAAQDARSVGNAVAQGLLDSLPNVHQAWRDYTQETKNALNPMKEIAWIEARLSGDKLAAGLTSKNPLTRARAELMRDNLMDELEKLQGLMGTEATQGSNALGNNLTGGPAAEKARAIMARLEQIFSRTFTVGVGVKAGTGKGKKAPGEHVGGGGRAAGGPVQAGVPYLVNEDTPRSEIFIPGVSGYIAPRNKFESNLGSYGGRMGPLNINLVATVIVSAREVTSGITHVRRLNPGMNVVPSL